MCRRQQHCNATCPYRANLHCTLSVLDRHTVNTPSLAPHNYLCINDCKEQAAFIYLAGN